MKEVNVIEKRPLSYTDVDILSQHRNASEIVSKIREQYHTTAVSDCQRDVTAFCISGKEAEKLLVEWEKIGAKKWYWIRYTEFRGDDTRTYIEITDTHPLLWEKNHKRKGTIYDGPSVTDWKEIPEDVAMQLIEDE